MDLFINNYPIEFTIEDGDRLKNVIESISEWAAERELIFIEVIVDGAPYSISDMPDFDVQSISVVNCALQSVADAVIATLEDGISYCEKALVFFRKNESASGDSSKLKDLGEGCGWTAEISRTALSLMKIKDDLKYRDKSLAEWISEMSSAGEIFSGAADEISAASAAENGIGLFGAFAGLFRMLLMSTEMRELVARSIDSPENLIENLSHAKDVLPVQLKSLEEASGAFQSGRDRDGMEILNAFIDFIYTYNRACYQISPMFGIKLDGIIIDGVSLEAKNRDLLSHLTEIIRIMENNDIISLSDILEYEIKPLLENLNQYIDELLNRATA